MQLKLTCVCYQQALTQELEQQSPEEQSTNPHSGSKE